EIGYDLLADPHEVQIVEVAATDDQVGQNDVRNCHAPKGDDRFHLVFADQSLQVLLEFGGQRDTRTAQVQIRAALHFGIAGATDQVERANHLASSARYAKMKRS